MRRRLVLTLTVVALVVVAVGGWLLIQRANSDPDYPAEVRAACHDAVTDRLKAPTTAEFSGDEVRGTFPRYEVVGYVDSQNSYGAQIRDVWRCAALHHEGEGFTVAVSFPG